MAFPDFCDHDGFCVLNLAVSLELKKSNLCRGGFRGGGSGVGGGGGGMDVFLQGFDPLPKATKQKQSNCIKQNDKLMRL